MTSIASSSTTTLVQGSDITLAKTKTSSAVKRFIQTALHTPTQESTTSNNPKSRSMDQGDMSQSTKFRKLAMRNGWATMTPTKASLGA